MKRGIIKVFIIVIVAMVMMGLTNRVLAAEAVYEETAEKAADRIKQLEARVATLEENRWRDRIAIHGVLAGAYQYEDPSGPADAESVGRGAVAFEPEIAITLTEQDEVFFKFGFPAGNGLNGITNMVVSPWAANLEGDVKNINGRDRDYLLTAWYKHTFELGADHLLGLTGGIIDATAYLDQNAYANDEYTQFMNPALVNGPNGFAPSYDIGGAVEWEMGAFYANGVVMNVGENDAGYNYNFYGVEIGYRLTTGLGQGACRIIYEGGDNAFLNPDGTTLEDRTIVFLSVDQQLGEFVGAWIRLGWGDDDAAVDATNLYSGGIDIGGGLWGRGDDNIGIGCAFFDGGNTGLQRVQVAEAYYRLVMNAWLALTGDVQYQDNQYDAGADTDIDAWTWGLRAVVEF
jgi:porin